MLRACPLRLAQGDALASLHALTPESSATRLPAASFRSRARSPRRSALHRHAVALGEPGQRLAPPHDVGPRAGAGLGASAAPPGAAGPPGCAPGASSLFHRRRSRWLTPYSSAMLRERLTALHPVVARWLGARRPAPGPTSGAPSTQEIAPPVGTMSRWPDPQPARVHLGVGLGEEPAAHPVLPGDAAHRLAPRHEVLDEGHPLLRRQLGVGGDRRRARGPPAAARPRPWPAASRGGGTAGLSSRIAATVVSASRAMTSSPVMVGTTIES